MTETELREAINRRASDAERMIFLAGISLSVVWSPPPMAWAIPSRRINLLAELFNLDRFQIRPNIVVDFIDLAGKQCRITTKETDRKRALRQTQLVLDRLHEEISGVQIARKTLRAYSLSGLPRQLRKL